MTRRFLLAAAVGGLVAGAAGPARAALILSITPSTRTVILPAAGSITADFLLEAGADAGASSSAVSVDYFAFAGANIASTPQAFELHDELAPLVQFGGSLTRTLQFTVDPTSIPGSYTGLIAIQSDADTASQAFTLVIEPRVAAVPEPSTLALGGIGGLLALGYARRRMRNPRR